MSKFNFIAPEENYEVKIRDIAYPVIKAGKGPSCLLICLGTPSFRTLSQQFADTFTIYSSDVYWIENQGLSDITSVTIDTIIDDIKALGDALNLKQYFIFAHSAYGIIALEFAKKYPDVAAGIIMVGTPVNCNTEVATVNETVFQQNADVQRKAIDATRRAEIAKEDLTFLAPAARWVREYIYRDAPRYWHIPDFDCTELWKGIQLDKLLVYLFTDILPKINVLKDLEKIKLPIFLAAGLSDYDCCPWHWKKIANLPKNFTIVEFNNSGHWPHYEEAKLFDKSIKEWMANQFHF